MGSREVLVTGFILVFIVFLIVGLPCGLIAWLGYDMLKKLAFHPSKMPGIQMNLFLKLMMIEIATVGALLMFYQLMTSYSE